jgi:hypothetical protein
MAWLQHRHKGTPSILAGLAHHLRRVQCLFRVSSAARGGANHDPSGTQQAACCPTCSLNFCALCTTGSTTISHTSARKHARQAASTATPIHTPQDALAPRAQSTVRRGCYARRWYRFQPPAWPASPRRTPGRCRGSPTESISLFLAQLTHSCPRPSHLDSPPLALTL